MTSVSWYTLQPALATTSHQNRNGYKRPHPGRTHLSQGQERATDSKGLGQSFHGIRHIVKTYYRKPLIRRHPILLCQVSTVDTVTCCPSMTDFNAWLL